MDLITLGLGIGTIAIVPLGAVVKKSYANEKRLTILETNYLNVDEKLQELRNEQQNQTQKLDRLIERFL